MHWIYRPGEIKDVAGAFQFLPSELVCAPELKAQFPEFWRQWLTAGLMRMTVLEDHRIAGEPAIVAFGLSAFVTDEFSEEAESTFPPYLSPEVARRWSIGKNVLLTPAEVMRGNSTSGLNLCILNIGWDNDRSDEDLRIIKAKMLEAFFFAHNGYFLKNVMQEVFSTEEMERGVAFGSVVKNDYAAYYSRHPKELPPPERRPYLIGARRGQVREGSYMSPLFHHTPPRFFFRPGEQELLLRALLDHADDELAEMLNLSKSAIHKKWRMIYARVAEADPLFFPSEQSGADGSRRGAEKRGRLLSYLRHHPEELRPIAPPDRFATRRA